MKKIAKQILIILVIAVLFNNTSFPIVLAVEKEATEKVEIKGENNSLEKETEEKEDKEDLIEHPEQEEPKVDEEKEEQTRDEEEEKTNTEEEIQEEPLKKEELENPQKTEAEEDIVDTPNTEINNESEERPVMQTQNSETVKLEEGIYTIATLVNKKQFLDVSSDSNVQIWKEDMERNQAFKITSTKDGYYTIQDVETGKMLDVYGGYTEPGTNVQMWKTNNTDGQKWKIIDAGNGTYNIIAKSSGLYLDIYGGYQNNGTNVQIWEANNTDGQKWQIKKYLDEPILENGIYEIQTSIQNKINLDIANNGNAQIWAKNTRRKQKFEIHYEGKGYYTIKDITNGKVLDVYGGYTTSGTNVQIWEENKTDGQKWKIVNAGNGTYNIIAKSSGLYLDIYGGYTTSGTNVQIWEANNTDGQKWKIQPYIEDIPVIAEGTYEIQLASDTKKVISVAGESRLEGANVEVDETKDINSQKFKLTYLGEGYYTITGVKSGNVLDVYGGYQTKGTNVQMWKSNNTDGQKWKIVDAENGSYNIIAKNSGLYLDIYGGYTDIGTNVQVWEANKTEGQKFKFKKVESHVIDNGLYEIQMSVNTNRVIDVEGASVTNGANIEIWERLDANNQKFNITYVGDGYYTISDVRTGKMLDVYGGYTSPGTNVQMWKENKTDGQKWKIVNDGKGFYNIISKCSGLYLDVYGGYTSPGTNVQIWSKGNASSQSFKLVETTKKDENTVDYGTLDNNKYPGIKSALQQIQKQHPNWTLKVAYTGLDWNKVVEEQDKIINGSPKSLTQAPYLNEWKNGDQTYDVSGTWYRASKEAIAYMMDPRNSLEEAWIFQFQNLSSSSGTKAEICKMVEGTFLDKDSIINIIVETAQEQGISPFHLVSRILQEQGIDGSGKMNGYMYKGRIVYNLFNIAVSGNSMEEGLERGAQYAYDRHWFTPEMCIIGSVEFLKKNYISKGQNSLYFQKYNVINKNNLYENQYMQNIRAANDEGNVIYKSYKKNKMLESHFEFIIPVYENMPAKAASRPAN